MHHPFRAIFANIFGPKEISTAVFFLTIGGRTIETYQVVATRLFGRLNGKYDIERHVGGEVYSRISNGTRGNGWTNVHDVIGHIDIDWVDAGRLKNLRFSPDLTNSHGNTLKVIMREPSINGFYSLSHVLKLLPQYEAAYEEAIRRGRLSEVWTRKETKTHFGHYLPK